MNNKESAFCSTFLPCHIVWWTPY